MYENARDRNSCAKFNFVDYPVYVSNSRAEERVVLTSARVMRCLFR